MTAKVNTKKGEKNDTRFGDDDMSYTEYLKSKLETFVPCGRECRPEDVHDSLFDFQNALVCWTAKMGRAAVFADCGLGKGLLPSCPVLTPNGFKKLRTLKVGDSVIGSNGKPCKVIGFFPRGVQPCYRVGFSDGTSTICDSDHLWAVRTMNDKARSKPWRVLSTEELAGSKLRYGQQESKTWHIPLVQAIEFEEKDLPVDPYLLGVLVGDGSLSRGSISWTNHDPEIAEEIKVLVPAGVQVKERGQENCWSIASDTVGQGHRNPVTVSLEGMGLMGKLSYEKVLPQEYLIGSINQRISLLQGLMDTDGYCGGSTPEFSTSSMELANQVVFLVQSLGGTARMGIKENPTYIHLGETRTGRTSYRVTFTLPDGINPFRLPRKADNYSAASRGLGRWISSIERVEDQETICIKVDAEDELFVIHDCIVTHNTRLQVEWARLTAGQQGTALIYAPLTVAEQTIEEGRVIDVPITYAADGSDIKKPGIYITNYERAHKFANASITAVVLDESSILKNFTGSTRNTLVDQYRNTPFRLCCTATPAPNDITEIANHSEFLGVKSRVELLSTYFVHDQDGWRLKGHATEEFYRWMASWAVYLRTPEDIGFDGSRYVLPPLNLHDHIVNAEIVPEGHLFPVEVTKGIVGRSELRKLTMEDRVDRVVELVNSNDGQWLVWVGLNDESALIQKALPNAVTVEGSDSVEDRLTALRAFKSGEARVLISKPKVSGFGINFQHCHQMVFCGLNDSWEQYYQAIRRCWRFGQEKPVDVHIVSSNSEQAIVANVKGKEEQAKIMGDQIIKNIGDLSKKAIRQQSERGIEEGTRDVAYGKDWTMWNGDCVEVLRDHVADNSVDLSVYSPPFATLYTYSDSIRDLGNCKDHNEFFEGYKYVCEQMLRVTKPGRLTCVHVQQLTTRKYVDGFIGLCDFRGPVVEEYKRAGWQHFGEFAIQKCPQAQAIRTKAHSLMFVTKNKDRSKIRPALADFILLFKKPGDNEVPIRSDEVSNEDWIQWAHPIWTGIRESDTLNTRAAKTDKDERHICPLQLEVIERCVKLWSNPGELVLSPFAGIGSEGYESIKAGRKFVGIELKREYWQQAQKNIEAAVYQSDQELSLFEDLEEVSA